ncbi:uncharacterized protein PFL1_05442 [Pseudozyma flocculosa PF-1]|uniref:RFX-type winged-helix domain-containing protein n=1 Tax=Pseudozyma flocculosa PF-1 TaxID=1277687 RepID=A0A061H982_9BASI|nr:uncharacterized protein PFL1_05442 [Pseudozyma flocculosa PF-1]EPQ27161.1 hypothetical protein PFL1_05442 [Pseudozyma flocculosa PF-1]
MSYPGTPSGTPFRGQPSQMAAHPAYAAQMQVQMQMQHQHQHQHQHHRQPHPIQAPPAPPAAPSQHHPQQQLPPQHFTPHHSIPAQPHPPHPSSFPSTPAQNRPIHPLPQHNRLQHLQHPQQHAPRSPASASPAAAASPLPARPSHPMPSASTPLTSAPPRHSRTHRAADAPPDARKRPRKIIGDGYEAPYLEHAPTNRLLLSLKSGLNTQIDWALSRLAANSLSKHHVLPFEKVSGLADALLAYPRRLCAAINAEPTEAWDGPDFEQPPGVDDVGIGAGSDGDHQAGATWFVGGRGIPHQPSLAQSSSVRRRLLLMPSSIHRRRARIGALITSTAAADDADTDDDDDEEELEAYRDFSFDPARIPAHAALMRRALEAALILRNMTMHSANARHLVSIRGVQSLIRDVLALPSMVLVRDADADGRPRAESEEWLELEGVTELRLHFLDILEGIAPRLHLSQRAQFSIAAPGLAGCKTASSSDADDDLQHLPHRREVPILPIPNLAGNLRAADEIFLQLLDMAHNSADRAFLLGSLRCLSAMSASERNESAFVEAELPGGRQSPGLLTRCIELLPLTQDPELIEAALDLVYQLVCIGNNGLRLAARMPPTPSPASVTKAATSAAVASLPPAAKALAAASASARSFARTFATVRLLVRNLTVGKTIWERDHRLSLNREWSFAVPGRSREAARKDREARLRRQNETAEDRAKQKRLTRKEKQALVALNEPERGVEWMKIVFSGNMEKEVTQMEFWTAYKDEFFALAQANLAAPLQPAADLIRAVSHVFPGAAAMVVPATAPGTQPRFVIRGIEVRERDLSEPFQCGWRSCPAKATRSAEAQREHAETHVRFSRDGECQWLSCDFAVAADDGDDARRQQLRAHVLTHLPDLATKAAASGEAKKAAAAAAATVVEAARQHSGEPAEFERKTLPNGSRYIKAKREASSDAAPLPLPDAGGRWPHSGGRGQGRGDAGVGHGRQPRRADV